jgi:hypothetical protein
VTPRARHSLVAVAATLAFVGASYVIFRGYLTPEMMVYFISFKWCF